MAGEDSFCLHDFWNAGITGIQNEGGGLSRGLRYIDARGNRTEVEGGGAAGYQQKVSRGGDNVHTCGGMQRHVDDSQGHTVIPGPFDGSCMATLRRIPWSPK